MVSESKIDLLGKDSVDVEDKICVVGVTIIGQDLYLVSTGTEREWHDGVRASFDDRIEMIFEGELVGDLIVSSA